MIKLNLFHGMSSVECYRKVYRIPDALENKLEEPYLVCLLKYAPLPFVSGGGDETKVVAHA